MCKSSDSESTTASAYECFTEQLDLTIGANYRDLPTPSKELDVSVSSHPETVAETPFTPPLDIFAAIREELRAEIDDPKYIRWNRLVDFMELASRFNLIIIGCIVRAALMTVLAHAILSIVSPGGYSSTLQSSWIIGALGETALITPVALISYARQLYINLKIRLKDHQWRAQAEILRQKRSVLGIQAANKRSHMLIFAGMLWCWVTTVIGMALYRLFPGHMKVLAVGRQISVGMIAGLAWEVIIVMVQY